MVFFLTRGAGSCSLINSFDNCNSIREGLHPPGVEMWGPRFSQVGVTKCQVASGNDSVGSDCRVSRFFKDGEEQLQILLTEMLTV